MRGRDEWGNPLLFVILVLTFAVGIGFLWGYYTGWHEREPEVIYKYRDRPEKEGFIERTIRKAAKAKAQGLKEGILGE